MWSIGVGLVGEDKQRLEEFYKAKIYEAFNLYTDKKGDKKDYILQDEVPNVMNYLGCFPSSAQVTDEILPQIQEDELGGYVKYSSFEPFMLKVLLGEEREFESDDPETLKAAFRKLDPERKGYIEIEFLKDYFCNKGIPFREREWNEFLGFAKGKEASNQPDVIYYEDYIGKWQQQVDKHLENLMKDFANFQSSKK